MIGRRRPHRAPLPAAPPRTVSLRDKRGKKPINLALQGGGAHGAFTWGVLDKLFEDDRVWIEALSGTSAGAMNAVVAAHGMYENGAVGAREALHGFWRAVSDASRASPIRRSPLAQLTGEWSLKNAPGFVFFDFLSRIVSPYELNPLDINPLRDLVGLHVDFEKVRGCVDMGVFIAATNVETGRVRVFHRDEVDLDVAMASACLPTIFKAVEIDGGFYWDGGFMGNPPLFPFFERCESDDIVIVQINPVFRPGAPTNARDIQNRLNEITFNSALQHELRAINFVTRMLDEGHLDPAQYRRMHMHVIHARKRMRPLDATSKLNAEWRFLTYLRDIGRDTAERWLARNYDSLGRESTVDIRRMFDDRPEEDTLAP
jgi:NTE family protein